MIWLLAGCGVPEAPPAAPAAPPQDALARRAPAAVVDCNGGGDHTTIQAAIDAVPNRSAIEVRACTYHERLDLHGKTVQIWSTDGPADTILDADNQGVAVSVRHGESQGTALIGFTVHDSRSPAVDVMASAIRLEDVVFTSTSGTYTVSGVSSNLELVRVTIDATNDSSSAAVHLGKGSAVIKDSTITCGGAIGIDSGHGGFLVDQTTLNCTNRRAHVIEHAIGIIERSWYWGDVAIEAEDDHPEDTVFFRNVFVDGDVDVQWGNLTWYQNVLRDGTLTLTDVAPEASIRNSVFLEGPCAIRTNTQATAPWSHNVFWDTDEICDGPSIDGWMDNRVIDPQFVDEANEDFHLRPGSPLRDAGVPDGGWEDVDGSRGDIGLYGGKFTQDGGW